MSALPTLATQDLIARTLVRRIAVCDDKEFCELVREAPQDAVEAWGDHIRTEALLRILERLTKAPSARWQSF